MKFLKLNIENFLVLTEASVDLADRGLVLIQGENKADSSANSNGAGKSSIADALCWAIYGVTARGESGDQVVNNKAGKNTRVEVILDDSGTLYRIVRHRKHKTGKNNLHVFVSEPAGEKDLTKGTDKLTQEVVEKIIGASLEVFTGSIYAGQEKMPDLPSMTDKMLKVLIEEAAGVNHLEAAYVKARENARIAKVALDGAQALVTATEAQKAGLEDQRNQSVASDAQWTAARDAQVEELTKLVRDDLIPKAKQLQAEAPQSEIDRLTAEIAAVDQKIASVGQEQAELTRLAHVAASAAADAQSRQRQLTLAEQVLQQAQTRLQQVEHKVGCPCHECGRPMTPNELAAARAAAQEAVNSADAGLTAAMTAADVALGAAQAAQKAHQAFSQTMTDVSKEATQRQALEAQRTILQQKDALRQQIVNNARNSMAQIERLKQQVSPFVQIISDLQSKIDTLGKHLASYRGEVAVKQAALDLETEVVRVFAPSGVRARVLDEVTPYLNGQTGKYLSILSDGNITAEWSTLTVNKAGEVKEKFAIDVSSAISSKTFKGLSGGEKRKVRVATALALQDLVSTRAAKPIDLFVGDEIDDALDPAGLERLMVILDEKAKERGTVMVISHNSLKDEIKQVLTVERSAAGETRIFETAA